MNQRLVGLWDWWFWHRMLTGELFDVLKDEHLALSPGDELPTLGQLFAEMADTQQAYIDSLSTRLLDQAPPEASAPATSVKIIRSHYGDLDRDLRKALEAISDEDVDTLRIRRDEEEIPIFILMSSLVEALLIFHGKVSVYVRLAGVEVPSSWSRYI